MVKLEEIFLHWLIDKAWEFQTLALPNPSVGALIADSNNQPLSYAIHQKSGEAHAELEALKLALITLGILKQEQCENLNPWELCELILSSHQNALRDCSIFVTLEPCNHEGKTPSCAKLLVELGIKRVFFLLMIWEKTLRGEGSICKAKGLRYLGGCVREEEMLCSIHFCV